MDWAIIGVLVSMLGVNLSVLAIALSNSRNLKRNGNNSRPVARPHSNPSPLDLDHIKVGDITLAWLKDIMTEAVAAGIIKAEEERRDP